MAELRTAHSACGIHRVSFWENECLNREYQLETLSGLVPSVLSHNDNSVIEENLPRLFCLYVAKAAVASSTSELALSSTI